MIILCEPQCSGYMHEEVNAGFLYGYMLAYPDEKLVFFGEKEHLNCIQKIFASAAISLDNVSFVEWRLPPLNPAATFINFISLFDRLFRFARKNQCDRIVFLSIYAYNLFALKLLLFFKYRFSFKIHIPMHGTLEFVKNRNLTLFLRVILFIRKRLLRLQELDNSKIQQKYNFYAYEKYFKFCLNFLGNKNICYYVFREDTLEKVPLYLPRYANHFKSIDMPLIYREKKPTVVRSANKRIRFTTFDKGTVGQVQQILMNLAEDEIQKQDYEIVVIGHHEIPGLQQMEHFRYLNFAGHLTREEIDQLMAETDYLLFFYEENAYELSTSGLLFDAVAYQKPVIFLKNVCFDYYFKQFIIGYRCESLLEMSKIIINILSEKRIEQDHFKNELHQMKNTVAIENNYQKLLF